MLKISIMQLEDKKIERANLNFSQLIIFKTMKLDSLTLNLTWKPSKATDSVYPDYSKYFQDVPFRS